MTCCFKRFFFSYFFFLEILILSDLIFLVDLLGNWRKSKR